MIIQAILDLITDFLTAIFSWLPQVNTLPTIGGFDIDTTLSSGMGGFYSFIHVFWPIEIMFKGFLFIMGYYTIKIVLRLFMGSRSPL